MLSTRHSFRSIIRALISSGAIEPDAAQAEIAEAFAALEQRLASYNPARKHGLLSRLFATRTRAAAARALLHGDVGRGKTMLMDMFFGASPSSTSGARISMNSWPTCMTHLWLPSGVFPVASSPMAT